MPEPVRYQTFFPCATLKLIICRTVASAPHVYARRAPSFWSSANVKASVTCRVWAITSSRTALRSFSVKEPGAQASASSISYSKSDTISAVRDSLSFSFSVWWLEFTKVFIHCGMDWPALVGGRRSQGRSSIEDHIASQDARQRRYGACGEVSEDGGVNRRRRAPRAGT